MELLDYNTPIQVSNIERGVEGVQLKRAAAWADLLDVPRDAFILFVIGERDSVTASNGGLELEPLQRELVQVVRALPAKYQKQLLDRAREYETLATRGHQKRKG